MSRRTKAEYQVVVVNTRDRIDFSLGRLSKAQSLEELLSGWTKQRRRSTAPRASSTTSTPPEGLEDLHDRLAEQLGTFAGDVRAPPIRLASRASRTS